MNENRLFALPEQHLGLPNGWCERNALGHAAEHLAIAKLLQLGYKLARPVVDDDGVDLIVDYRTRVQVKASSRLDKDGYVRVNTVNNKGRRACVELWLVYDLKAGVFYVIPDEAVGAARTLSLSPKYDCYREAWELFRATDVERAA